MREGSQTLSPKSCPTTPAHIITSLHHSSQLQERSTMRVFMLIILFSFNFGVGESTIRRYVIFVRNLLFAPQDLKYSNAIIFDPNQGAVNMEAYKRAYGYQGRKLVDAYGKGFSKEQLQKMGYL